jgi:hypothetical protein
MSAVVRVALAIVVLVAGCNRAVGRGPRSPTALRDAQVAAMRANDPKRAYALLAPEVQARVPYDEFALRWRTDRAEREAATKAAGSAKTPKVALLAGTSVHDRGVVLRWSEIGGKWVVVDGLPGRPSTATPAAAVRAFVTAVRTADLASIRAVLGDELGRAIAEDWEARVQAIEAALDRPGALELSADLRRAELRYEPTRVLTLEQTPAGWRIVGLE